MPNPPIQLISSFITDLEIISHRAENGDIKDLLDPKVIRSHAVSAVQGEDRRYGVELRIELQPPDTGEARYTGKIVVWGLFEIASDYGEDKHWLILNVTATSILYTSAREALLTITGRCPYGGYQLPTTSFMPDPPDEEPDEDEDLKMIDSEQKEVEDATTSE